MIKYNFSEQKLGELYKYELVLHFPSLAEKDL